MKFGLAQLSQTGSQFWSLMPGSLFFTYLNTVKLWEKKFLRDNYHNKASGMTTSKLPCKVLVFCRAPGTSSATMGLFTEKQCSGQGSGEKGFVISLIANSCKVHGTPHVVGF